MKIIFSSSISPAFNLAAEQYLFSKPRENFLLLYVNEPSVIVGSNQAVLNEVDIDFCIDNNIAVIRRLSGGGAVYHDKGNLNYSFIHDKTEEPLSNRFLIPVLEVLKEIDIPAAVGKRKDLWLDGYKISGTASHLSKGRELHHGTLLYNSDIDMLWRALSSEKRDFVKKATQSVVSPVKNIIDYIIEKRGSAPETEDFFLLITERLVDFFGLDDLTVLQNDDISMIGEIQKNRYSTREWNYRK